MKPDTEQEYLRQALNYIHMAEGAYHREKHESYGLGYSDAMYNCIRELISMIKHSDSGRES